MERGGGFAVVAHDIICFLEGGSQGHSERRGEEKKSNVCFPKRLCSVCGREGPLSRVVEMAVWLTDRQTKRPLNGQGEIGRKVEAD